MSPRDARRNIQPDGVEYRADAGSHGVQVVRVWTVTATPRFVSYLERGSERVPLSMFRDEIEEFCDDATQNAARSRGTQDQGGTQVPR